MISEVFFTWPKFLHFEKPAVQEQTGVSGIGRSGKQSEIAANSTRTFVSFHYLERGTKLHEHEQTVGDQLKQHFSPNECPEGVDVHETDMSPAKTLTIQPGARMKDQAVSSRTTVFGKRSPQEDHEVSVSEYCAETLRSLGLNELDRLGGFNEQSFTTISDEGESQVRVARVSVNFYKVAGVSGDCFGD